MSTGFPRFRIYESNGVTLVYDLEFVLDWGNSPLLDPETFVLHKSLRGQGGIVSEGSQDTWELPLTFRLIADDYESLIAKMQLIKNAIEFNTKYFLKIDLTTGGSTLDLKVKRLSPITFPLVNRQKTVKHQTGILTLTVNSWA